MTNEKTNERVAAAETVFRTQLLEQYDLESDFVDSICGFFRSAVAPLAEAAPAPKRARGGSSKPRRQRKKSAYNVYVREMMKTEDIQKLSHKEKMGAIAALWKDLDDEGKVPYTDMANAENTAAAEAAEAEESA